MGLIDTSPTDRQTVFDMRTLTRPDRQTYGLFGLRSHILTYSVRNVQYWKIGKQKKVTATRKYIWIDYKEMYGQTGDRLGD